MPNYTPSTLALLLLVTLATAPANANTDKSARRIADAMLKAQVEMNGVPGMSAAVTRNGMVIWQGSAGHRDLERKLPVTDKTSYRFASVSKLITATAAAKLGDQGKFNFTAPLQTYVAGLNPQWGPISANQLAAHISGIPHYQDVDADRGSTHYANVGDAVTNFANRPLLSEPGSRYKYSSFGFTLLSAAVEANAGQPFLAYVAQEVTRGLDIRADVGSIGLHDTQAYEFRDNTIRKAPDHDYSYSWGGAGFRGTAKALALFGAWTMDPKFLSDNGRRTIWTPINYANGEPVTERDYKLGFGWRIGNDPSGEKIVHHAGVAIGARSSLVVYPEARYSVSVLSNAAWVSSIEQTATMLAAPFRTRPDKSAPPCPLSVTSYEGTFGTETVAGTARFSKIDGQCHGFLSTNNAAGTWFNSWFQKDASELQLFALTADGRLGRTALITPSGIYDFKRRPDGSYSASIETARNLTVRFTSNDPGPPATR